MAVQALVASLVAALALVAPAGRAQAQNPAPAQGRPPAVKPPSADEQAALERIKAAVAKGPGLDLGPTPSPDPPDTTADGRPIYRSHAEATLFKMPDFKDTLNFGFEAIPPGGRDLYEFNRLVTPPEFRGVAMFTNREVVKVMALALRNALALKAIRWTAAKTFEVIHEQELQKIREEIRAELAAIDAASKAGGAPPVSGVEKKDEAVKGSGPEVKVIVKPGGPIK